MSDPIFDNDGKQIAYRFGSQVFDLNNKPKYDVDPTGNLLDLVTQEIVGHLIPVGRYLPNGERSPAQALF
jgi:hypothetical protein